MPKIYVASPAVVTVFGYHGTTKVSAASILENGFRPSRNKMDWLGAGVYFWQDAPGRAMEWAHTRYGRNTDLEVIRAEIELTDCLDLLDIGWAPYLRHIYERIIKESGDKGHPIPQNHKKKHELDCAVIDYAADYLTGIGQVFRCVRAAFQEDDPIYATSRFHERSHVQIAVRDVFLIKSMSLIAVEELDV